MSSNMNISDSWAVLRDLTAKIGGTENITTEDVQKLLKDADKNKDGKVTEDEFKSCFKQTSDYKEMEEKYLNAFKVISKLDGAGCSISDADILNAINAVKDAERAAGNTPKADAVDAPNAPAPTDGPTGTDGNGSGDGLGAGANIPDFSNMTLEELQVERDTAMNNVDSARTARDAIQQQHQSNIDNTKNAYDSALENFDTTQIQDEALAQQLEDQKQQKANQDEMIANQKTLIEDRKTAVTNAKDTEKAAAAKVSDLEGSEPTQTESVVDGETVKTPDDATFAKQHSDWEASLAEAKEEQNQAKAAIAEAMLELEDAEKKLVELEDEATEIDNSINDTLAEVAEKQPDLQEACNAVTDALTEYNTAKENYKTAVAQAQEELDNANAVLEACTQAISDAKAEEYNKKQSEMADDPVQIADMLNDPELTPAQRMALLQDIAGINRDNVLAIVDGLKDENGELYADTDALLVKAMNELLGDENSTVYDITQIALFYTSLDAEGGIWFADSDTATDYRKAFIQVYEKATSQEEIDYLNEHYSIEDLTKRIQECHDGAEEAELLEDLNNAVNRFKKEEPPVEEETPTT